MNACISIVSSRQRCILGCLDSLWKNYNSKHDYPVYVHYFDDIYDSPEFLSQAASLSPQRVIFKSIPYETPSFIKEHELFYNRQDLWYVRNSFPIHRKGYLHMCHFMCNMYGYENTEFENHDYVMTIDDESMFVKEMPYNVFDLITQNKQPMGAMKVLDQNIKRPHQGNFDTRVGLWEFIQEYINRFSIQPKSKFVQNLLEDPLAEQNFHFYPCADSYVINIDMIYKSPEWSQWISAVNQNGGIYKYRWGDNDIYSWYYLLHVDDQIYDLKTVDEGYHAQGALRHLQDYAPGVRDLNR